jgi:cyclic-di-AMP phosphodiesterase PgpH
MVTKSTKPGSTETSRRKRKTDQQTRFVRYLETSPIISGAIFVLTAAGIGMLSLIGIDSGGAQIIPHQVSPIRVTATVPFDYRSELLTERERQRRINLVGPAYSIQPRHYEAFADEAGALAREIDLLDESTRDLGEEGRITAVRGFVDAHSERSRYTPTTEDILSLLEHTDPETRQNLFREALRMLEEIHRDGIYSPDSFPSDDPSNGLTLFTIYGPDETRLSDRSIRNEEEARLELRSRIESLDAPESVILALRRIIRDGLVPNFEYDETRTEERKARVARDTPPVMVGVEEGDTIIRPGTTVTEEQYEMYLAYRETLASQGEQPLDLDEQMLHRLLLVVGILLSAAVYIRIEDRETLKSNSRLALLGLLAAINLSLVWSVIKLVNVPAVAAHTTWMAAIPYLTPTAFSPLIVAMLIGQRPAIFMALIISFFAAIMFGYKVEMFVVAFLAALVGIYYTHQVRFRGRLVKAACLTGLTVATAALFLGLASRLELTIIVTQMAAGLAVGALTGIIVVGLLPILETLFRRITDITLLELTDTNHPLLKRMQMEAPGSYHHSLVVANLAENAAGEIDANPLKCRVCALFHDIGKLVKPEYFTENQRDGFNPHSERNPSFSALIIKSHVKEGVDLAVNFKLPRVIIDVIRQHHGTTLIEYFFHQAKQFEKKTTVPPFADVDSREGETVSETTYRYDGPKPQFKESAVIFFADAVEAASRSLKKVNQQNLEDLIDKIFRGRIEDGQLDECPLTMDEISRIKKSFCFTLLNMLHSRVEYPSDAKESDKRTARPPEAEQDEASENNAKRGAGSEELEKPPAQTR